jgi:hypothetical protein
MARRPRLRRRPRGRAAPRRSGGGRRPVPAAPGRPPGGGPAGPPQGQGDLAPPRPDAVAWGHGRTRRGRAPMVGPRPATRLNRPGGRWADGGLCCPQADQRAVAPSSGHRRDGRDPHRHACQGPGPAANPRAQGASRPVGRRDTPQDAAERRARQRARAVLAPRSAERSADRLQHKSWACLRCGS